MEIRERRRVTIALCASAMSYLLLWPHTDLAASLVSFACNVSW